MVDTNKGPMPFFVVCREADTNGVHSAYIDRCPHGQDMGHIYVGPKNSYKPPGRPTDLVWQFEDLGNGRCRLSPSILAKGIHGGQDCHFGPGEFEFMWIEDGEYRNTEPFASRYRARTGREP